MKKLLFTFVQLSLVFGTCYSQSVLDKAKSKLSKGEATATEFQSLSIIAGGWEDGSYGSKRRSSGMYEPGGKKNIEFKKDADGDVNMIVLDGKEYKTSATASKPFVMAYSGRSGMLYLTKETIIMYNWRNGNVWTERCYGKKIGIKASDKEINAFREFGKGVMSKQESEYSAKAAEKSKVAAAARLKKFGLADKEVAKIEVINIKVPEKFGHFRGFTFSMQATLKDGTVISTKSTNEGYMSDYTITYSADNYESEMFENKLTSGFVDGDAITIIATCKSNPALTVSEDVVLKYNEDVSFNSRNGMTYNFGNGGNAMNYRFEVKQVKHAVTNKEILMVRIINISEGSKIVSEFKMSTEQTLHFSCNGGNGGDSHTSGIGNGGNGGNITVIKDPSVKYFNFDYSINAGNKGGNYSASRGRDGSYKEEIRAVKF